MACGVFVFVDVGSDAPFDIGEVTVMWVGDLCYAMSGCCCLYHVQVGGGT